ncbi:MAG TPA: hypothetical protein VFP72_22105 [Kineosporiaceae bacterium]|nr:hypothetical protein [Kineosporiaceae bacterium]
MTGLDWAAIAAATVRARQVVTGLMGTHGLSAPYGETYGPGPLVSHPEPRAELSVDRRPDLLRDWCVALGVTGATAQRRTADVTLTVYGIVDGVRVTVTCTVDLADSRPLAGLVGGWGGRSHPDVVGSAPMSVLEASAEHWLTTNEVTW